MAKAKTGVKTLAQNRKARHDYHIEDVYEAGIALTGTEIKSVRAGRVQLKDSFARIQNGEVLLYNMHISPYEQGNRYNHDPMRARKLLLHRSEINRLIGKVKEKGLTLIPLKLYWQGDWAKVELGLAKGKQLFDKRDALAAKESKRDIERALKERSRG